MKLNNYIKSKLYVLKNVTKIIFNAINTIMKLFFTIVYI